MAILALPLVFVGWLVWSFVAWLQNPTLSEKQKVSCAEALDYAGGGLPEGATDGHCDVEVRPDTTCTVTFRMPRADVQKWLTSSFPGGSTDVPACEGRHDLCWYLDRTAIGTAEPGSAYVVEVGVVYEDGNTALVHLTAYDL
ncbi:hypothetical protein GCM10020367_34020 [Streptomyces sannanensis]|uniref:DUF4333 domain-containing protein n=2 Tax=Streptomyces sannanensis TaxID=285536 RepID=A0ABP6SCR0_9ACTN